MIALDDAALARLCIGATAVPVEDRTNLLERFADAAVNAQRGPPARSIGEAASDSPEPVERTSGRRSAAERMRRFRERVRAGRIVLKIEIGESEVDALYDAGLLHGDDCENHETIAAAIERLIELISDA